MTFRGKIFFYGGIILLFIIGLILAIIFRPKQGAVDEPTNNGVEETPQVISAPLQIQPITTLKPATKEDVAIGSKESLIQTRVKNFVEIFGSYSVEANFINFTELKPVVTDTVAKWLLTYPEQLKNKQATDFVGVTTRVLSQKITDSTDNSAAVLASTQREETRISGKFITYPDITIKLVLVNGVWLVDGAYWE